MIKNIACRLGLIIIMVLFSSSTLKGDELILENFDKGSENRWNFFSDQVMGGISTGKLYFQKEGELNFINLVGDVSTENQGGFIQARSKLAETVKKDIEGIVINAKGNNTTYYIHLRTTGTLLPWQYYQAEFSVTSNWREIKIPLMSFKRSGSFLRKKVKPASITSIGLVAYGRDHKANLSVASIRFY